MANHGGDRPPISSCDLEHLRNLLAELVCEAENHDQISPTPSLTASSTETASPTGTASPTWTTSLTGIDSPIRIARTDSPTEVENQRHRRYVMSLSESLLKKYDDEGYKQVLGEAFTNFPGDVGFNNGLYLPQPDFIEGIVMQEYQPFSVGEIRGAVLYENDRFSLVLPHIAGEWKREGYDMEQASLRSAYHGAALVYARNQALSYIGESDPDRHASIVTFTTDGHHINFFAHYTFPSEDGRIQYHQYPIISATLTNSDEEFRLGLRKLQHFRDRARKLSYALRDRLKEHWNQQHRSGLS